MTDLDLVLFRGFGGDRRVCVAGRLMRKSQLVPARKSTRLLRRLRDGWRLVMSKTIPGAELTLECGITRWTTQTDKHGYFFSCKELETPNEGDDLWSYYTCRAEVAGYPAIEATGEIMRAAKHAQRIIISDIDDTIVQTGVAHKLRMFWALYFARSGERMPFPGMSAFLQGLHRGGNGDAHNPMLYVSRSPWSIYPVLDDFFNRHDIPFGPVLLLRDWGVSWRHPFPRRAREHKAQMIDRVMQAYPDLPVILIGDSGQHDPEIYLDVIERHPNRVQGIYIRDLSLNEARTRELAANAKRLASGNAHLFAAADTEAMAADAAAQGWIEHDSPRIVHRKRIDEAETEG